MLFARGHDDLNIRATFLHMAGDAAISAGVVLAAVVILLTGRLWIDPAASLAIAALITVSTWGVLRDSMHLAMDGVPARIAAGRGRGLAARPARGDRRCTTCTSGACRPPRRR